MFVINHSDWSIVLGNFEKHLVTSFDQFCPSLVLLRNALKRLITFSQNTFSFSLHAHWSENLKNYFLSPINILSYLLWLSMKEDMSSSELLSDSWRKMLIKLLVFVCKMSRRVSVENGWLMQILQFKCKHLTTSTIYRSVNTLHTTTNEEMIN